MKTKDIIYRGNMQKIMRVLLLAAIAVISAAGGLQDVYAYKPLDSKQTLSVIPSNTRTVVSLAGTWEKSYDNENWESVRVPFSESELKTVTYKKTVKIDRELAKNLNWQLFFLGLNHQVEIYFNEQFVGRYFGGNAPLSVKIPDKMIGGGTNEIRLVVSPAESALKQIEMQYLSARKSFIGVLREAFLVGSPGAWISDLKYKTSFGDNYSSANVKAKISVSTGKIEKLKKAGVRDSLGNIINVSNKTSVTVECSLLKKSTRETVANSETKYLQMESERTVIEEVGFYVNNPSMWSPDSPELYELKVKITQNGVLIDDYFCDLGFKDIQTKIIGSEKKLFLNGKPLDIKGVSYIEDHAASNQSVSAWRMEEDVQMIKTLGANTVRVLYSAPHPYFAALCDKFGILMTVELPLYNVPSQILALDEIKVQMKNLAKQFMNTYDTHPSLLAWGLADGLDETAASQETISEIIKIFKSNSAKPVFKIIPFGTNSPVQSDLDFVGFKVNKDYIGSKVKEEILRMKALVNVPVFLTYGIAVQPKNHNGYSDPLSIEHQAFFIRSNYNNSHETGCVGSIINSFNDYPLNNPYLTTNNDMLYVHTTGIVDRNRSQRLAFQTLQALFNDEKEPLLNAGSYSEKTPVSYVIIGIALVVILLFLVNRFRRFREYLLRSLLRPYNFYSDIRDQRIMSSIQTILLGLLISFTASIYISSVLYFLRSSESAHYILMLTVPSQSLQEVLFRMVWMPEVMMLVISLVLFLIVFFVSLIVKIFAFFTRARIFYTDALTITIWAGIPLLILLPFGIVLIRLLVMSPGLASIFVILFLLMSVWVFARLLKSTSVVFDKPAGRVYAIGTALLVLLMGTPLAVYQLKYSLFAYMQYFADVFLRI